jgi:hypothetical protein
VVEQQGHQPEEETDEEITDSQLNSIFATHDDATPASGLYATRYQFPEIILPWFSLLGLFRKR